jgi:hypothetical protein
MHRDAIALLPIQERIGVVEDDLAARHRAGQQEACPRSDGGW